jgi:hypothetical protein
LRCHGERGLGGGEAADDLTPSPALLAYLVQQPIAVDQYLLWSISEGGKEFGTAMPAFKDTLTRDQIWKIIAYLRAGLPDVDINVLDTDEPEALPGMKRRRCRPRARLQPRKRTRARPRMSSRTSYVLPRDGPSVPRHAQGIEGPRRRFHLPQRYRA